MKLTTKKTTEQTIEIELPKFWKHPEKYEYLGVINNENVMSFSVSDNYKDITNCQAWLKSTTIENANNGWQEITEEQFLEAHAKALQSLSLVPILHVDDVREVL